MQATLHTTRLALICFTCIQLNISAQDMHFSQYYNFPLFVNPANTGDLKGNMRAVVNYRSQWSSVAIPYTTTGCSLEGVLYKNRYQTRSFGAGLMVLNDKAGQAKLTTNLIFVSLAGSVKVNTKNSFALGMQAGLGQKSVDLAKLTWGNQYNGLNYDPNISSGENYAFTNVSYQDISAGINWNYDANAGKGGVYSMSDKKLRGNLGIALYHINRPNTTLNDPNKSERLYRKLIVNGSLIISSKVSNVSLIPSFLYEMQGPSNKTNVGFMTRYLLKQETKYTGFTDGKAFSLGCFYRYQDALVISSLYEYHRLAFGISYDVNVSKFIVATSARGGIELSLRYMSSTAKWYNPGGKRRTRTLRAKF